LNNLEKLKEEIRSLFGSLSIPQDGLTLSWLAIIKHLRTIITNGEMQYGSTVTVYVESLVKNLRGSAIGTWAISSQLIEIYNMCILTDHDLRNLDNKIDNQNGQSTEFSTLEFGSIKGYIN
jgi:hypothetical protein